MIGWVIAGLVGVVLGATAVTMIDKFWDNIASWLNNTAADAVEKVLGQNARKNMHRAVITVGRLRDRIHNNAVVYAKQHITDSFYEKITYSADAPEYKVDEEVIAEIQKEGKLIQTFEYKNQ